VRRIAYLLIWLAVTLTAVFIASAAVSSVRDQVTDTPTAMLPPTTIAPDRTEQQIPDLTQPASPAYIDGSSSPTTAAPTTTTSVPLQPTTTVPSTTISSSPTPSPAPTTTTTTTATVPPTTEIRSYELVGGSVSVEIGDGTVRLAGASPKPGFTMEVESSGPEKVEVEFHNDEHRSKFSGKFEDGKYEPSISESGEEEDD
jgi:hypothetical protein